MKRKIVCSLFILFGVTCLLSGCGEKEHLRCFYLQEQSGLAVNQIVNIKFKDGKVSNVKLTVAAGATNKQAQEKWDEFIQEVDKQYPEKTVKGLTVTRTLNKEDYVYKLILDINLKKVSNKDLESYGLNGIANSNAKYSDTKETFEKSGFTCEH